MRIKFLGHATFLIESKEGTKIITDPYKPGAYGSLNYKPIPYEADIVTVSHEHDDHNYVDGVKGNPEVVKGTGEKEIKGIKFKGIQTFHDKSGGKERGLNTVFVMDIDGFKVCHLGDIGDTPTDAQFSEIGKVDVLLIPVGGHFTVEPDEAWQIAQKIAPKVIIPMHFKTEAIGFPIKPVDDFIRGKENVKKLGKCEVEITQLPEKTEIWVLEPELK